MTNQDDEASKAVLRFEGEMTIYTAMEQVERIREHFPKVETLEIDCTAVSEMDSAGLQVLMFAKHKAEANGIPFCLTGFSETVNEVLTLLQLHSVFSNIKQESSTEEAA